MLNQITHSTQDKKIDLVALKEACATARGLAIEASKFVEDKGTCNLDATFLHLWEGARPTKVIEAIKAGGLGAYKSNWIGNGVMIHTPVVGQADKNRVARDRIVKHLRDCGFRVSTYDQMD